MVGRRSALIVASEAFADPGLPWLRRVAVNASALADALADPDIGDFDVQTLVNAPAQAIRARVAEFFAGRGPGDVLLVYYAGYGIRDDHGELYLAAADTVPGRLEPTAVPAEFISQQIGSGGSRQVALLLDCAEYLTFPAGLTAKGSAGPGMAQEFRAAGQTVIAAYGGPGYAAGGPAFTAALVEGLETGAADRHGDGRVGLDDLYDYAARRMRDLPAGSAPGLGAVELREGPYIARGAHRPTSFGPPRQGRLPGQPEPGTELPTRGWHRGTGPRDVSWRDADTGGLESATAEPAALFWNTWFPQNQGILHNRPHLVVAGAVYELMTGLGPKAEPGAVTSQQQAARLLDKQIRYRLEAENGEFRLPNSEEWQIKAESEARTCTAAGTDPFVVYYRARGAGTAVIRTLLIVDNGSVDQQQIKLTAVADDDEAQAVPRSGVAGSPARPVGRSVAGAPSPDYNLGISKWFADLWHRNTRIREVQLQPELAGQLDRVATSLYADLREASRRHRLQGGGLRVADSGDARLLLARAGAELHYRLFREPLQAITGGLPAKLGEMADYLRDKGDAADPPLLQIIAHDFPLPWGLLYDRSSNGGRDLQTAADVDPDGFWGRRFDIYRSVVSVDRDTRRGKRRWVRPVIGADVPRNVEQRAFVDGLRSDLSDTQLRVEDTITTVPELMAWATSGGESDLVYLFCHTRPARYQKWEAGPATNWLGLGQTEDDARVGLDELERWWGKPRLTNPIVILNACSSGQQDVIYGAPFVEFFMDKWGAQAFIGTDWPINSSFADVFGRRLLREILQNRRSLRDAFRVASDEAAADDNFFPLMYAVYGLNTVQFDDPL